MPPWTPRLLRGFTLKRIKAFFVKVFLFMWDTLGDNRFTLFGAGALFAFAIRAAQNGDYLDALGCVAIGTMSGGLSWYGLGQGQTVVRG